MGRRWFDDLTGDDLADENVHTLAITLDGDPLAAYDVGARPTDELLAALRDHLVETIAARIAPDEPLDPGPLDEQDANDADPGEASGDDSTTAATADAPGRQPIESPAVTIAPAPRVGEADGGRATDAQVRRWAIEHNLPCSTTGGIKAWLRPEYERLDGGPPDFPTRRLARENGAEPTTPPVRPEVAGADTIATWCLRNGVEDRGGRATVLGRQAYAEAWRAAHPEPPAAGTSASGQDPPPPDERAGRAARSGGGVVNGSVRPPIEPIGDGTGQPPSSAEQLARADELAAEGMTPRQICSEAGVWLSEARAAVRKATER